MHLTVWRLDAPRWGDACAGYSLRGEEEGKGGKIARAAWRGATFGMQVNKIIKKMLGYK